MMISQGPVSAYVDKCHGAFNPVFVKSARLEDHGRTAGALVFAALMPSRELILLQGFPCSKLALSHKERGTVAVAASFLSRLAAA
jgi:hypothetical protein